MRKKISIIDYGVGNYASLHGMFNRLNCLSSVTNNIKEIKNSDFEDVEKFIEESINKLIIDNDEKTKKTKKEL